MSKNTLKRLTIVLLCILLLGLLAFLKHQYWYTMTVPIAAQEDDIREAVLRDAFRGPIIQCGLGHDVCCMSLEGAGDPSDTLLLRLEGRYRKGSECQNGTPVSAVTVGKIRWVSRTNTLVTVRLYCGNLCGAAGEYSVYRDGDNWIVFPLTYTIA